MSSSPKKNALIFGATGLIGWGIVNELLSSYPQPGVFSMITAVANRPISAIDTHWPEGSPQMPELQVVTGINLLEGTSEDLAMQLKDCVKDVGSITHVFYTVFVPINEDYIKEAETNSAMMLRVAEAVNSLCQNLESFVYMGGTRGYGIYIPNGSFTAPLEESMADNLSSDYAKTVAYPGYRRVLTEASKDRCWKWSEICPDAVVGFSPIGSNFSLALHWAQYLSLYSYNHNIREPADYGKVQVAFPGSEGGYNALFTPVSTQSLGRISIHASLNSDRCGGRILNAVDHGSPTTFRELWPKITGWFGLQGVGPAKECQLKPSEYIDKYRSLFEDNGKPKAVSAGVGVGNRQLDSVGWWLEFDRQLSPDRLRASGFEEESDPIQGWLEAFEKFRAAGIIL
ncbi:hypothetical protein BCIN_01g01350 [Botrytis cinerea B05.10]|uniref:PRISE-like Rossmann-fold domain-containing protein n=2 Tax=Botryotinia fuckeliana TaxID=40559 RepID=A0A384J492_BOTFB|nr:hypothetical protein BCIN_01g01350 [Botrytis cinerea B05.10]ATZ45335.1 hypothetical protein BCIN_01g01350 [Botrytis cinerea B05.10]EMR89912.1 putative sirq protein [Botrytis cinerea BcDW1]